MEPIRVLVVDDHPVVREGLLAILATQSDIKVVGEATSAEEASALNVPEPPHVAVLDLRLPGISGIQLLSQLRSRWPEIRAVIFTSYCLEEEVYAALEAGAWAYVRKGAVRAELLQAIRAVHSGQRHIPPEIAAQLAEHIANGGGLSVREREVLAYVRDGSTNKDIAGILRISEHTVNLHVKSILNKLGASSRTEAVTLALRKGILPLD
jgi:two-component system, NarL family, response regulator